MNPDFWKYRSVFITGATGFLGSWMVKALVEALANVTVLVRDWVPQSKLVTDSSFEKVNAVRGELEDFELLQRIINEYEVDTVFHLGAQTIVTIANNCPLSTFDSNVRGTWNLLEAARSTGRVERIVLASSDKAYGIHETLPYDESMPLQGAHPYDVSKSCADLIARMYHKTYGLPVSITRCGNFYGGGDLNFNRIIPGTIRSVLFGEDPVIRSDGLYIRDYFYIEDGVEAYLHLAEKMKDIHCEGEAFNFSNELQINVLDLVNRILSLMGSEHKPKVLNMVKNEIPHQYLSAKKAREILGWQPKYSLDEGLTRTIDWYKKFLRPDIK